jgi:hypothetical protein
MDGYISAAKAIAESVARTAVDLAGAALLTYLTAQAPTFDNVAHGSYWVALGMSVYAAVVAGLKRKFWPISTDRAGRGRRDLEPREE